MPEAIMRVCFLVNFHKVQNFVVSTYRLAAAKNKNHKNFNVAPCSLASAIGQWWVWSHRRALAGMKFKTMKIASEGLSAWQLHEILHQWKFSAIGGIHPDLWRNLIFNLSFRKFQLGSCHAHRWELNIFRSTCVLTKEIVALLKRHLSYMHGTLECYS